MRVQIVEDALGGFGHRRAGREDRGRAALAQRLEILRRDYAADDDHNVGAALPFEGVADLRYELQMAGGERRNADDTNIPMSP